MKTICHKNEDYEELAERIGQKYLNRRLSRQMKIVARYNTKRVSAPFLSENDKLMPTILKFLLNTLGHYQRGMDNALKYRVEKVNVPIDNLPFEFNGFRILQLTDIHANTIMDNGDKLIRVLRSLEIDMCVLTGDFRFSTRRVFEPAIRVTKKIVKALDPPYGFAGILGNHDFVEFVPLLESMGIKMFLNEALSINKNGDKIWLAGIDDEHYFKCSDIPTSMSDIPEKAVTIMLSHSPETYIAAEKAGVNYLICGHTHGGQICLPGNIPILKNARCPRRFCSGQWHYRRMKGYTSRGVGVSSLPVRFFCPPEITLHELNLCA